jgi:pyridoxal phosphate enzyme (YggS family)
MVDSDSIAMGVQSIQDRIEAAALSCGREPKTVKLVAATKTFSVDHIRAAMLAGVKIFGENYVQEAREKIEGLDDEDISWHFIGHLQSNKAKYAVKLFDLIHTVDSTKLARELDKRARGIEKVQKVLVQVNISGEGTKSGIDTAHALDLVGEISTLENVAVRGLMTMPPYFNAPEKVRPYFQALKALQTRVLEEGLEGVKMEELSMGMTGDFETAIEEGATLVRIGTAIFGEREQKLSEV